MYKIEGKHTTALITTDNIDETCIQQIQQVCDHPAFKNPIAIMPDAHTGKGAVIGFTMKLDTAVVPEVVGVDIGCGMLGARLNKQWQSPEKFDRLIRENVPMGFDTGDERANPAIFEPWLDGINNGLKSFASKLKLKHEEITLDTVRDILDEMGKRAWYGIGSLGGGNHFIEVDRTDSGDDWIIIHSGSRNFGLKVCEKWQDIANNSHFTKDRMREICMDIRKESEAGLFPSEEIPERIKAFVSSTVNTAYGISWLEGERALGYLKEMLIAQAYASLNRRKILEIVLNVTGYEAVESLETIHNYICAANPMTIRKGAVSAQEGEKFILPLNMAAGVLICKGKGNEEWNNSAPHGAGRKMSRKQAFRMLDSDLLVKQMEEAGIFTGNDPKDVLDEAPDAYKPEGEIIALLSATADIIERMRPIHNIKANEQPDFWQRKRKK